MRTLCGVLLAGLLVARTAHVEAEDRPLNKVEIARLGKAATALVEVSKGHGSAFCIHASGFFVTNEHVIRGENKVTLVLKSGEKDQKVLTARVLRRDADQDLALLQAEGVKDLPVLGLGSADDLQELEELIACGFPFGKALSADKKEFPAVSINVGSVSSLRKKEGELHRIQLDGALNPGNSGGPVLDRNGKVVGVVVAGVKGAGVNFAIPVHRVRRLIDAPEVEFTPPVVNRVNVHKKVSFEAKAFSFLPGAAAIELELALSRDGKEQRVKLEPTGAVYRASIVPVEPPKGPQPLRVRVRFADKTMTGLTTEKTVKVDGKERKLSDITSVTWGAKLLVCLADGSATDSIEGLDSLEVEIDEETVKVDLRTASALAIEPGTPIAPIFWTLLAKQNGKEIKRKNGTFFVPDQLRDPVRGPVRPVRPPMTGQDPPAATDVPADNQLTPVTAPLVAGNVTSLALTPDGKYLLLLNQTQHKLQRFELAAQKLDGAEATLTAGSEGFALSRNGDVLYTFASPAGHKSNSNGEVGKIQVFESPGLKLKKTLAVDFDPFSMAVHDGGFLFFTNGSNQSTSLGRFDVEKETIERVRQGIRQRSILRMTPDQSRLYWSSTDTSPGSLQCLVLPPLGKKVDDKEIMKLIDQLVSANSNEREEATRALEKIGERALPLLKKAAESDDETRSTRAKRLLDLLEAQKRAQLAYRAPYHGTQPLGGRFEIAPDGQYIICTGGCVLTAGREQDKDLRFVAKVEPHVVACAGKEDKLIFAATRSSTLLLYSYPEFALKRTLLLKGAPREMIFDEVIRCLYAFVPAADGKSGDLHVYDLKKFVADK